MNHQVTVELPDHVYQPLVAAASATGKSVAEVVVERLATGLPPGYGRLRRLAGTADTGLTDLSVRHHEYIGDEARGRADD